MTDPFYSESGGQHQGLPLVLLHGFCETHHLWDTLSTSLGQEMRVLCPDLPGFGHSSSLAKGFSLPDVAARMAGWLEQLGIAECILIGHSLGGYVALEILRQYPQYLAGIGLFHSTALADSPQKRRSRNNVIDFVEKHGVEEFATSFVPQLFYHTHRRRLKQEVAAVVTDAAATPQHTLVGYTKAMRDRANLLPLLQQTPTPVLLIIGEKDSSVPLDVSLQHMEALPRADAYVLEETGHMGMLEKPEESLAIVRNFVRQVQKQKSS